ncbi:uncharacterized protein V1516DRAFT_617472 [Lipomyces oligophaga]|uniref:uncharacterized protein n=1 Tax=Lipomyces oligophaga TaxID=45792 RepID=UPI0034CD52FC
MPQFDSNIQLTLPFDPSVAADSRARSLPAYPTACSSGSTNVSSSNGNPGTLHPLPVLSDNMTYTSEDQTSKFCASGPIPAAAPALVRRDERGVDWIAFQYSKERVRTEYCIRCDVGSIDISSLSRVFRKNNCIYPRADIPESRYKGNRYKYETECNRIGWALAHLNPTLQGKRGLLQRAVDSWRNSHTDPNLRSRRVRKMNRQAGISSRQNAFTSPRTAAVYSADQQADKTDESNQTESESLELGMAALRRHLGEAAPAKKFKYISIDPSLVSPTDSKIRVRVGIDRVDLETIPDKYRLDYAVYPRSILPSLSLPFQRNQEQGQQSVDGPRRRLEQEINEMGIKMAWLQPRVFEYRVQYLQRALDIYRAKLVRASKDNIALCTRKGKQQWLKAMRNGAISTN